MTSSIKIEFYDEPWSWKRDNLYDFLYKHGNVPVFYEDFFYRTKIVSIIKDISDTLEAESKTREIYPEINLTFRALRTNKPKALILGQDPYFNPGSAVGLCFSLPTNATHINPSFRSIQKEVASNGFKVNNDSGDISNWSEQGVLLLNAALTVAKNDATSHTALWAPFTEELIEYLSNKYCIAWALWGRDAQCYESSIKNKDKQLIIKTSHPSPLACRTAAPIAFIGSSCFTSINNWLSNNGMKVKDWSI